MFQNYYSKSKIEIFKTDVSDIWVAENLVRQLIFRFPNCKINFDLQDCDNILRIEGNDFDIGAVKSSLETSGYKCECLS